MANPPGTAPAAGRLKVGCLSFRLYAAGPLGPAFERSHVSPLLVQAGGIEPPTTRLSATALTIRTGLREWCVRQVLPLAPPACRAGALLMSYGRKTGGPPRNQTASCGYVTPVPSHLARGPLVPGAGFEPANFLLLRQWPLPLGYPGRLVRAG